MKTFRASLVILLSLLVFTSCMSQSVEPPEFAAQEDAGIKPEDLDISLEMCEELLRDSYLSKTEPGKIDLERYIVDENLLKYSRAKVEKEAQNLDIIAIDISIVHTEYQDNGYFITLNALVKQPGDSRFGEATHFLIRNQNGRLVVADWFTEHGTVSFFDLLHRGNQGVTNPTIWEYPDAVKDLLDRAGIQ